MKRIEVSIKEISKKYISTNILFLSFVILSILLGIMLRGITVNTPFYLKSILGDLIIVLLFGSFGYLVKPKYQFRYFFFWLLFSSCLCVGNTIYYEFYHSFLSINLLSTASMIGGVNDALFDKIHIYQFVYLIIPVIFIFIHKKLSKKNYYFEVEKTENGKKMFSETLKYFGILFILMIAIMCLTSIKDFGRFAKQWNREYLVSKYGLYIYTITDLVQSAQPKLNTLFGYDEAAKYYRDYYSCKWSKTKSINKYTNIFEGKNVIFIHAESIQNFLINLKINGEYVTPNLNRLASEGMYFSKFYPQISVGTSSDTEFTLTTGLMPSSSGTVFVNYYDREYYAMPKYFNDKGYYTFSMHANEAEYWNRKEMHKNLGYQYFFAKSDFIIPNDINDPEYVGLGLSDKSFYHQIIPTINNIKETKSPFFGTIISLSNHSPFDDIDKYGEFDLRMKYSYIDEYGNKVIDYAPYLENTDIGNYIKSSHYADEALGLLFDELQDNGLLEETIFIIYGDHEARLSKSEFDLLYNYDPVNDSLIDTNDVNYISMDNYNYDLLKNTPFIIWSNSVKYEMNVEYVMGMYDVLPTIANMFGFEEKYSLGNDIFSSNEKIVVFPNGNILTDRVYYSNVNDEYITFSADPIESDYIERIKEYATNVLDVSNGIIAHDLIKNEGNSVGECINEKK